LLFLKYIDELEVEDCSHDGKDSHEVVVVGLRKVIVGSGRDVVHCERYCSTKCPESAKRQQSCAPPTTSPFRAAYPLEQPLLGSTGFDTSHGAELTMDQNISSLGAEMLYSSIPFPVNLDAPRMKT
jgi:hypothetical protein